MKVPWSTAQLHLTSSGDLAVPKVLLMTGNSRPQKSCRRQRTAWLVSQLCWAGVYVSTMCGVHAPEIFTWHLFQSFLYNPCIYRNCAVSLPVASNRMWQGPC